MFKWWRPPLTSATPHGPVEMNDALLNLLLKWQFKSLHALTRAIIITQPVNCWHSFISCRLSWAAVWPVTRGNGSFSHGSSLHITSTWTHPHIWLGLNNFSTGHTVTELQPGHTPKEALELFFWKSSRWDDPTVSTSTRRTTCVVPAVCGSEIGQGLATEVLHDHWFLTLILIY